MKSDNPIPENPATERSGLLIRDLNADEKPREKANRFGMDALTDVELLALLLGSGMRANRYSTSVAKSYRTTTTACGCCRVCRLPS